MSALCLLDSFVREPPLLGNFHLLCKQSSLWYQLFNLKEICLHVLSKAKRQVGAAFHMFTSS